MNTDIWSSAFANTKTFIVGQITQYDVQSKNYLQGCKNCNNILDVKFTREWGQAGNCMQRIVMCTGCKNHWVMDAHKENDYLRALKYQAKILNP